MTRQWPPRPLPGPPTRGSSTVCGMRSGHPRPDGLFALAPVALETGVELIVRRGLGIGGGRIGVPDAGDVARDALEEGVPVSATHELGLLVEAAMDVREMAGRVLHR